MGAKNAANVLKTEPVKILLVDDRPSNLRALQGVLKDTPGYALLLARSGAEALAHVLRHDIAVILLDIAMPGMDGFEVATLLKQRERSKLIPIIFITASVYDMEHVYRGYPLGFVDYIRKPLEPGAVRIKVAVFVELYRQRKLIGQLLERLRTLEEHLEDCGKTTLHQEEQQP